MFLKKPQSGHGEVGGRPYDRNEMPKNGGFPFLVLLTIFTLRKLRSVCLTSVWCAIYREKLVEAFCMRLHKARQGHRQKVGWLIGHFSAGHLTCVPGYTSWASGYTSWASGYTSWTSGHTSWASGHTSWGTQVGVHKLHLCSFEQRCAPTRDAPLLR